MTNKQLLLGELFAGYGGLGLAVEEVFGAKLAWYAEFDAAPSKIMAHHWPDTTNYGDVTTVDWATIPPVDIISGGSPCQDLSLAGRRAGMTDGTRSNLWESMREAIATIKPTYVVWENVRGALSAKATSASDLEPGEGSLGDRSGGHLRALGRVLGDLADLGYDCQWRGLRAADVGAPHGRFRVFILATRRDATTQNAHVTARDQRRLPAPGEAQSGRARADAGRQSGTPATNPADHGQSSLVAGGPESQSARPAGRSKESPADTAGDPRRVQHGDGGATTDADCGDDARRLKDQIGAKERGTTPTRPSGVPGRTESPANTQSNGRDERRAESARQLRRPHPPISSAQTDWGPYTPAVRRWEAVRGTAPAPTELTAQGKHRLSPKLTEWMMGLPSGWVTNVPISRNEQLKACGNGVVPQQAAAALRHMLATTHAAPHQGGVSDSEEDDE